MKQSKLFTKTTKNIPTDEKSINSQLLIRGGFINKTMAGVYTYLPLGWRVIANISKIVREEMDAIGGQEILMPALQPKQNWKTTGRWDSFDVLFKLKGVGEKEYALGPTHEEIITPLVKNFIESYKDLPLYIYQIQNKFRNEARPKSGILRGREFIMKDLYSFHENEEDLEKYYAKAQEAYDKIYQRLGLFEKTYLTFASGGAFSKYSHEYQTVTKYGEDVIFICHDCNLALNEEIVNDEQEGRAECIKCGNKKLSKEKAIEVGNIFKLKTKFTEAFDLKYRNKNDKQNLVIMGCYGLGVSRLMGAVVEVFNDKKGIIWPKEIAPFQVHLISLSDNDSEVAKQSEMLYNKLLQSGIDVLYDDREESPGSKFADSDLFGIPWRLVISKKTLSKQSMEIKKRNEEKVKLIKIDKLEKFIKYII